MRYDPVTRRGRAIQDLLRNMSISKQGWTIDECTVFLVKRYGYGLRRATACGIVRELVELGVMYHKGARFYVRKG